MCLFYYYRKECSYSIGMSLLAIHQPRAAVKSFDDALSHDANYAPAYQGRSDANITLGNIFFCMLCYFTLFIYSFQDTIRRRWKILIDI